MRSDIRWELHHGRERERERGRERERERERERGEVSSAYVRCSSHT